MKSIRISQESYDFLKKIANNERRRLSATLDLFVEIFKEVNYDNESELARKSLLSKIKVKSKVSQSKLVKGEEENI